MIFITKMVLYITRLIQRRHPKNTTWLVLIIRHVNILLNTSGIFREQLFKSHSNINSPKRNLFNSLIIFGIIKS